VNVFTRSKPPPVKKGLEVAKEFTYANPENAKWLVVVIVSNTSMYRLICPQSVGLCALVFLLQRGVFGGCGRSTQLY